MVAVMAAATVTRALVAAITAIAAVEKKSLMFISYKACL